MYTISPSTSLIFSTSTTVEPEFSGAFVVEAAVVAAVFVSSTGISLLFSGSSFSVSADSATTFSIISSIISYEMVENLAHEIVKRSNQDIWKKACECDNQNGSIMGSTFVFIFIIGGAMYTYCLGDSPVYLIRKENAIPMYCPDSAGYEALKKGMSYSDFKKMEGKDSIALYVGGEYSRNESDYYTRRSVDVMTLQENDIVIASSDGVLDYMGSNLSDTDWDRESALVKLLTKQEPLDMRATHIISKDNKNGGGDNLSVILIKVGGHNNE